MSFNAIEELKSLVTEIEGKIPTKIEDVLKEKVEHLRANGITAVMHVGRTDWTQTYASEWLLGQFVGIVEKAQDSEKHYNSFGSWLQHVYHFVIDNKANLKE